MKTIFYSIHFSRNMKIQFDKQIAISSYKHDGHNESMSIGEVISCTVMGTAKDSC